jgi:uncharacterized membrane protein SpoIIM required for sporulation
MRQAAFEAAGSARWRRFALALEELERRRWRWRRRPMRPPAGDAALTGTAAPRGDTSPGSGAAGAGSAVVPGVADAAARGRAEGGAGTRPGGRVANVLAAARFRAGGLVADGRVADDFVADDFVADDFVADDFVADYLRVCRDLALAGERGYGAPLVDRLNDLAQRGHNVLYAQRRGFVAGLVSFFVLEFPRRVRADRRFVLVAALAFVLPQLVAAMAIARSPDAVYAFVAAEQVAQFERMYDPGSARFGWPLRADSALAAFGFYVANNIGIGFQCFATGIAFGAGALFFLVHNGFSIGAVTAHLLATGHRDTFLAFVVGHGAFELPAIVLAGAAGLKLGSALLWPGRLSRRHALVEAAHGGIRIVYGVFLMLLLAAFIEAYWSANALLAPWTRYLVGGVLWLLVLAYFVFAGRGQRG